MTTPTLGGIELPGTETIRVEKTANIIPLPIPTTDSDQTEVFDFLGVLKFISISGVLALGTVATTKAKIDAIEALVNGNQVVIAFTSDQTGTVNCMVASFQTNWEVPGFSARFELRLIQGRSI